MVIKKNIKKTIIIFVSIITFISIGSYIFVKQKMKAVPSELIFPKNDFTFNFVWSSATINKNINEKAGILIPIKLNGCPETFYMQFDIGTFVTHFYKPELESINKKFKNIHFRIDKEKDTILANFSFNIGETKIRTKKIDISSFGETINWNKKNQKIIIGSIGPDFINNKTICIDYPNQKISLYNKLPDTISKSIDFFNFEWYENKALLPITINGEKRKLYFDTGSSTFEILTTKKIANEIAENKTIIENYKVGSWGKDIDCYDIKLNEIVVIGKTKIPIERISYIDGLDITLLTKALNVDGLTGNKLFLDKKIYLDTKNQKFSITK